MPDSAYRRSVAHPKPRTPDSILYHWPVVGWCIGTIKARNTDGRFSTTIEDKRKKVNFIIHYEIDDERRSRDGARLLACAPRTLDGGDEDGAWVLLEAVVPAA